MIARYQSEEMAQLFSLKNRYQSFLDAELAVLNAYETLAIIPKGIYVKTKQNVKLDFERIKSLEATTKHDVVAFTRQISETLGEEKRFFHYKLTSTDVVDTAQALVYKKANQILARGLKDLIESLVKKAKKHRLTPCIGRTHGIHAEVTSFGLKLAYHIDIFKRLEQRFLERKRHVETGKISGAVGNHAHVSPEVQDLVCQYLNIDSASISTQVLSRDYHADYLSTLTQIGSAIDNLATEIRHLSKTEVGEVEEGFSKGQKGSSAMPHKKNPIASENMSGCARMLRGYMQMGFENIVLWHERDISHSSVERVALCDAVTLLDYMLKRFKGVVENLVIHEDKMLENINLTQGLIFSQNVLHALIDQSLSREDAYDIIQPIALEAKRTNQSFMTLLKQNDAVKRHLSETQIDECFTYEKAFKHLDTLLKRVGID